MKKLMFCLFILIFSCQYDGNSSDKSKKEVGQLSVATFNVPSRMVRVKSTIAWEWKDSAGFTHQMDAGEFVIDNGAGNGKITITDSTDVKFEPCADYYEKKNSESSIIEVDKTLGNSYNRVQVAVAYGTNQYLELLKPCLIQCITFDANYLSVQLFLGNGLSLPVMVSCSTADRKCSVLPKGKYLIVKQVASTGEINIISLSKENISALYTITTVNPGW